MAQHAESVQRTCHRPPSSGGGAGSARRLWFAAERAHVWKAIPFVVAELGRSSQVYCYALQPRRSPCTAPKAAQLAIQQQSIQQLLATALEVLLTIGRAIQLSFMFSPVLFSAPLCLLAGYKRDLWMDLLYQTLRLAGPAFIKWGQWAATRADLFPPDMCAKLARLQADAPAHGFAYTKREVESAFGVRLEDLFETFEVLPVASGSIAQIHRAILRPGFRTPSREVRLGSWLSSSHGEEDDVLEVAVKVRHPRVAEVISRDFAILKVIAHLAGILPGFAWMRLHESVQQFRGPLFEQVDLRREADNLRTFNANFRSWKDVRFPVPVDPLVESSVLVETFEHGLCIAAFWDSPDDELRKSIAEIGCKVLLKMMLADNFVHADLHPGNILVRTKEVSTWGALFGGGRAAPQIVLLDCGMTASLTTRNKYNLLRFFEAITKGDGKGVAEMALAFSDRQTCPDPDMFVDDVVDLFDTAVKWGFDVNTSEWMSAVMESIRRHKVHLASEVCSVVVTALVLEGWSARLDPQISIMEQIRMIMFGGDRLRARIDQLAAVLV